MKKIKHKVSKIQFVLILLFALSTQMRAQKNKYGYVAIGGGGYVTSIIASPTEPNVFYAKTDVGGIFRWNEITQDWTPLFAWVANDQTSYMGTESFAIDPTSPNKHYALAGTSYWDGGKTAILKSTDYGNSYSITNVTSLFKANGNGSDRQKGETLVVDSGNPNILYCGARYYVGLFKSKDAGATWNKVATFPDSIGLKASISFVALDNKSATESGCQTIIVASLKEYNNIHISKDGGLTWKSIGGNTKGTPQRYVIASDRNMYVTYRGTKGGIYKYNLDTEKWTDVTPPYGSNTRGFSGIDADRNDPKKLVCSTYNNFQNQQVWGWGDFIYYSTNGGLSWVEKAGKSVATMETNGIPWMSGKAIHWTGCTTFNPAKPGWVFAVSGNGVFATENIAAPKPVWKVVSKGLEETVPVGRGMMSVPGGPLMTSVGDQGGFIHTDITKAPQINIFQSDAFAYAGIKTNVMLATADQTDVVGYKKDATGNYILDSNGQTIPIKRAQSHIRYSPDFGKNWYVLSAADTIQNGFPAASSNGKTIMWLGFNSKATPTTRLYWTENKGITWTMSKNANFNSDIIADPVDSMVFYGYNSKTESGFVLKSTDGGKSFTGAAYIGTGGNTRIKAAPGIKGSIWISFGSSLKYTLDGAKTFKTVPISACASFALGKAAPDSTYPTLFIWGKPTATSVYGMYRSIDKGKSWVRANDDDHEWGQLANAGVIEADQNVYSRVYKSTAGMGIPYMELDMSDAIETNSILDSEAASLYPNPFKQSITLKINSDNLKSVSVFTVQGVLVRKFTPAELQSGLVEFGDSFAPGVYLVQVAKKTGSASYKIIKQ